MKNITVFKRGQVWFLKEEESSKGSIQCKSRPYLVVSNDICNTYSSVIHMAPITSKIKKVQPTHVVYYDNKNNKNTILVEQIMPKSVPHILRNSNYMYTLSEIIMEEVNQSIMTQFGIVDDLSAGLVEDDYEEDYNDILSDAILEVAATSSEESKFTKQPTQIEKFNRRVEKYKSMNGITSIPRNEKGRIIWDDNLKRQFLEDSSSQGIDYVISKYHIGRSTYYKKLSKFKDEFSK